VDEFIAIVLCFFCNVTSKFGRRPKRASCVILRDTSRYASKSSR